MFQDFSQRAIRVMVIARLKAGQRGANSVEVDDLLSGIIADDRGEGLGQPFTTVRTDDLTSMRSRESHPSHRPCFESDVAKTLLSELEKLSAADQKSVAPSADIPLSAALHKTLDRARGIKEEFKQDRSSHYIFLPQPLEVKRVEEGESFARQDSRRIRC